MHNNEICCICYKSPNDFEPLEPVPDFDGYYRHVDFKICQDTKSIEKEFDNEDDLW